MHWRATSGPAVGGNQQTRSHLRTHDTSDLELDERELGAIVFALCCAASPFVMVSLIVFGYMKLAPLFGLPAVPAF